MVWSCRAQHRLDCRSKQAECGCREMICHGMKTIYTIVIENDRKKLDMDSAAPQNRSEWRGHLRERLVKKPNPR